MAFMDMTQHQGKIQRNKMFLLCVDCWQTASLKNKKKLFWKRIRAILQPWWLQTWPASERYYSMNLNIPNKTVCEEFWPCTDYSTYRLNSWVFLSPWISAQVANLSPTGLLWLYILCTRIRPLKNATTLQKQGVPRFTVSRRTKKKAIFQSMGSDAIIIYQKSYSRNV